MSRRIRIRGDEPQTPWVDHCAPCLLEKDEIKARGSRGAKYLIVTKPAREYNVSTGHHLSMDARRVFDRHAQHMGFTASDFVFTSCVRCDFQQDTMIAKDRNVITKACRGHLLRIIEKMKPDVIIPMGADAASMVEGRKVKITKARGVPTHNAEFDCMILPMLDPDYVVMYPQHRATFATDFKTLRSIIDHNFDLEALQEETTGTYMLIDDLQFLVDLNPSILSFDIETRGLRFYEEGNCILTMQFCVEEGTAYVLPWEHPDVHVGLRKKNKIRKQLRQLLCNPETRVIGQNLKYDADWIYSEFNIRFRIDQDTLMLYTLLDENSNDKNLDHLIKLHVPEMAGYADSFNSKWDKTRMDLVPINEIKNYGGGDVDAVFRLWPILHNLVCQDIKLYTHYRRVSIPALNAFVPVEVNGMLIDEEGLDDFEEGLTEYVEELRQRLIEQIPREVLRDALNEYAEKNKGKMDSDKAWSFSRRDFLVSILFTHRKGFRLRPRVYTKSTAKLEPHLRVPSTSTKDHLPYFYEECPFTVDLSEYVKTSRLLGTNVQRFRENYMVDGLIHPIYSLTTAVTGRSASKDPNGQNFPVRGSQAKAYKRIFVAPPGYYIVRADLSQAEIRIAGDMADDPVILQIYREYGDIHTETALIVMGLTQAQFDRLPKEERSLARFKAKAVNFGFLYGMGWRNFIVYAKTQYGVEFTEAEAQRIREGFFHKYPGLRGWHGAARDWVRIHKFVRSYSGRIRHLPMIDSSEDYIQQEAERQAINSPVQEFASSLGLMAMATIDQRVDPRYMRIAGFVHDALYTYVPKEYMLWGARMLKHCMETLPIRDWFGVNLRVPIVSDVSFGNNGSEEYELKGLTTAFNAAYDLDSVEDLDVSTVPRQLVPHNTGWVSTPEHLCIDCDTTFHSRLGLQWVD